MLAVLASVPAAWADESGLLVSSDGTTFGESLDRSIFENTPALVPLESEQRSVWILNNTDASANVRLSIREVATSSLDLASSLVFTTIDAGTGDTTTLGVGELDACEVVLPSRRVAAGESIRVDLVVGLRNVADSIAQEGTLVFALTAAMRDDAAGPFPADTCDNGITIPVVSDNDERPVTGPLAVTGTTEPTGALVFAIAALTFGLLLLAARCRRRAEGAT